MEKWKNGCMSYIEKSIKQYQNVNYINNWSYKKDWSKTLPSTRYPHDARFISQIHIK